jgi:hypothetical protein
MRSLLILLALIPAIVAADPVAAWRSGQGTIAGTAAVADAAIADGAAVAADAAGPVDLVITGAPRSLIRLSPGGAVRLIEQAASPKPILVIELDAGAIEVDLPERGRWGGLHVRGGALNAQVVGTLFVVERSRRDSDFVAVMRGRVKVGLRTQVARVLGAAGAAEVELGPRQGVEGNPRTGLGQVEPVQSRPSVAAASAVAAQARTPDPDGTTWTTTPTTATIANEVMTVVVSEVGKTVSDTVTEAVVDQVLGSEGSAAELGLPPGPP